jgi:hypothetical protein
MKMKRLFSVVLVALAFWLANPANAQVKFGVRGGLNVSEMSFNSSVLDKSNNAGFYLGPTIKIGLPLTGLSVDASALYDQRSADVSVYEGNEQITTEKETIKQKQLALPVNLRYSMGIGDAASVFFFAGPQFGFNLSDDIKNINWEWKNTNFSINLGVGIMALSHLEASIDYNIGCGHTGEVTTSSVIKDGLKGKSSAWQIGVAYYF